MVINSFLLSTGVLIDGAVDHIDKPIQKDPSRVRRTGGKGKPGRCSIHQSIHTITERHDLSHATLEATSMDRRRVFLLWVDPSSAPCLPRASPPAAVRARDPCAAPPLPHRGTPCRSHPTRTADARGLHEAAGCSYECREQESCVARRWRGGARPHVSLRSRSTWRATDRSAPTRR